MEMFYIIVAVIVLAATVTVWMVGLNVTYFLGISLVGVLVTLPVYPIFYAVEKNNKETFYEFWNGYELDAVVSSIECVRDGSCSNTYRCDPYLVTRVQTYTDSDGNMKTRTVVETEYHSCPYSKEETTWSVNTSLGSYTILADAMTGIPFRDRDIPGGQVLEPPQFWSEAKERIDKGEPSGVTVQKKYKNYILGSSNTIFKQHEAEIVELLDLDLLPAPANSVHSFYMADKAYFVGVDANLISANERLELSQAVMNLNGRSGSEVTADVHVVFVDASKVDIASYAATLNSYWLSPDLGRYTVAKNAAVVVFGVETYTVPKTVAGDEASIPSEQLETPVLDEDEAVTVDPVEEVKEEGDPVVVWARAFTGMPVGNEAFIQEVQNFKGEIVDTQLIGKPFYDKTLGKYSGDDEGLLESILLNGSTKYERISMSSDDADDVGGGFKYLSESYVLSDGAYVWVYIISSILILVALVLGFSLSISYNGYKYDFFITREAVEKYFSEKADKKGNS